MILKFRLRVSQVSEFDKHFVSKKKDRDITCGIGIGQFKYIAKCSVIKM